MRIFHLGIYPGIGWQCLCFVQGYKKLPLGDLIACVAICKGSAENILRNYGE